MAQKNEYGSSSLSLITQVALVSDEGTLRSTLGNSADAASVHSSDNTNITFARIAERLQSLLIAGTIVGGDSLFDAIELRHCDALSNTLFIGFHCFAPCKEAATIGYDGWPG